MTDLQLIAFLKDANGRSVVDPDLAPGQSVTPSAEQRTHAVNMLETAGFAIRITGDATLLLTAPKQTFERTFDSILMLGEHGPHWQSPPHIPASWRSWLATVQPAVHPQLFP